jgi:hypothetical protein
MLQTQKLNQFIKTVKQCEAVEVLVSLAKNVMLYGGSRSGKTFIIIRQIIIRAVKVKSKHLIVRLNFNHAKRSIWLDTLPKVFAMCFPDLPIKQNKSDFYYTLPNGSEIWVGGLDDKERVEKILGTEYSTIYFNESSQIDYSSVQITKTRLAEKNSLIKKAFFDENPPTKAHWSYWLFIKKLDPLEEGPISDPENYASLLMNPKDNIENIDEDYLNMLSTMPEKERNRFLNGEFNDESAGSVYYSFNREKHVKEFATIPGTKFIGMDFNVDPMTATIGQFYDNKFWISDEVFLENSDTYKMCDELKRKALAGNKVIPDSTGKNRKTSGQSDFEILRIAGFVIESTHNPFVTDRVNNVNRLFLEDRVMIHPRCKKLINDLEKVVWKSNDLDQSGKNKHLTHISDSLGYMLWKLEPFKASLGSITSSQR